jgi:hypothetical protein
MSDYVGLVALSNPPLTATPPTNSILSLFGPPGAGGANAQLTDYDYSFLSGLYGVRLNLDASTQRASITSHMDRELRRKSSRNPSPDPRQN